MAVCEVVDALLNFLLVHLFRNLALYLLDECIKDLVLNVHLFLLSRSLCSFSAEAVLVLVERIELAYVLCELIVEGRELLALDLVQLES